MDIWQITTFTLITALAATALMIPVGLALAWLLASARPTGIISAVAARAVMSVKVVICQISILP